MQWHLFSQYENRLMRGLPAVTNECSGREQEIYKLLPYKYLPSLTFPSVRCVTKYHDITEDEVSNVIYTILMGFKLAINLAKVNTEKCIQELPTLSRFFTYIICKSKTIVGLGYSRT